MTLAELLHRRKPEPAAGTCEYVSRSSTGCTRDAQVTVEWIQLAGHVRSIIRSRLCEGHVRPFVAQVYPSPVDVVASTSPLWKATEL